MIGKTLGHYQVTREIGKGGMGEVYLAKDQKLGRDVAIKVLPEEFARDADRVARFQREAKVLASLNHPNIAAIHGLEESDGTNFLVLELVEGETLADRIKDGPIPVKEALKLALQIAEALEAAHEKGVIHRDLKPANIKVTSDGKVKVLDFGLAKAYAGDKEEVNLSNSPTLSDAATRQGVILGTAAYMSPEQAKGKPVDKRADIWSFGVVLFEMLTGKQLFSGETVSETLAAVLMKEPDFSRLPQNLHPKIIQALKRCLEKEIRNRYNGIGDARVDIQETLADPSGVVVPPQALANAQSKWSLVPWLAAVIVVAIIGGIALWKLKAPESLQVMRFEYVLPEGQQLSDTGIPVDVSPDGKQLVYSTSNGLYLRPVDELRTTLITGTEGETQQPFFSPDSRWIGYFSVADRQLKKISVNGGAPVPLCAVQQLAGANWGKDNTIIYGQTPGDLMEISADGGTPKTVIKVKTGTAAAYPQILPDGKSMLYTFIDNAQQRIMVQSLKSGHAKDLFAGVGARYIQTGHIVYLVPNNNTVFGVPFNLDRLEVTGGPVPAIEGVSIRAGAFSNTGTVVYIPTITSASERTLAWIERTGQEELLPAPPNMYRYPNISPDGKRIAISVTTKNRSDIWIWDLVHKTLTPLTFEGHNITPVWSPDGKRIAYWSNKSGKGRRGIYWKAADGAGQEELLSPDVDQIFFPYCWTNDGKYLVGGETRDTRTFGIGMLSIEGDHERKTLLSNAKVETQPQISTDGRWMAYSSNESGRNEIYVRSFPDISKGRWQVSTSGGDSPRWSPNGRELFYLNGDAMMAVSIKTDPGFDIVGTPATIFRGLYVRSFPDNGTPWALSPDGKRFLMIKVASMDVAATAAGPRKINIILNWFEELKQRVPGK